MDELLRFDGRINRRTLWLATIPIAAVNLILYAIAFGLLTASSDTMIFGLVLIVLVALALGVVALSFQVRRWHDLGKSGWWSLVSFIPVVGGLYGIVMLGFMPGATGSNSFGESRPDSQTRASSVWGYLSGTGISILSTFMFILAAIIFTADLTGSSRIVGYSVVAMTLAMGIGYFIGPDLIKRIGNQKVAVMGDLVASVCMVVISMLIFADTISFVTLWLLIFLGSVLIVPGFTARRELVSIFPSGAGDASMNTRRAFALSIISAAILGPLFSGLLAELFGIGLLFLVAGCCFLVAGAIIALAVTDFEAEVAPALA